MAGEDDIIQRVVLEGDQAILQQFKGIGKAGEEAFGRVEGAANRVGGAFGTLGGGFSDVVDGLRGTGAAAGEAAVGVAVAEKAGLSFASTLRLIGRAARIPELSRLGKIANVLSKAFAAAAPVILLAGLERLAAGATKAADAQADLQSKTGQTAETFTNIAAAGVEVGVSSEEMGASLKAVKDIIKDTADNATKNAKTFRDLKQSIADTRLAGDNLVDGFRRIGQEAQHSFRDFKDASRKFNEGEANAARDFATSLKKIQEQRSDLQNGAPSDAVKKSRQAADLDEQEAKLRETEAQRAEQALRELAKAQQTYQEEQIKSRIELRKLNDEIDANDRKLREETKALAEARAEADRNATALEKLGIIATQSNGKLKKAPEVLLAVADGLRGTKDEAKRLVIEQDLLTAGLDRKLLPALRLGAKAFQDFEAKGKRINPGFTQEEIDTADKFNIAVSHVGSAFEALTNKLGIAIAPHFMQFFNDLAETLVAIRPGLVTFGETLSKYLEPILNGISGFIRQAVVPAFQALTSIFDMIASGLNKLSSDKVTGVQLLTYALVALALGFAGLPGLIIAVGAGILSLAQSMNASKGVYIGLGLVIAALAIAFGGIPLIIAGVVAVIGLVMVALQGITFKGVIDGVMSFFTSVRDLARAGLMYVVVKFAELLTYLSGFWPAVQNLAGNAWQYVADKAQTAVDTVVAIFTGLYAKATGIFTDLADFISKKWESVKDKIAALFGAGQSPGAGSNDPSSPAFIGPQQYASGGMIRGRGTATSDSIPLWGSNGEFMMRAKAVAKYGVHFMHAVNQGVLDPRNFSMGGTIDFNPPTNPTMKFAEGGLVASSKNTLNLTIDGKTFNGLSATDDTMGALTKFATQRQLKSAGRKPVWKG